MENVWILATLWVGLALIATLLSTSLGAKSEWIIFLAGTGAIVLTFLAGAELDPTIFRTKWKEATIVLSPVLNILTWRPL